MRIVGAIAGIVILAALASGGSAFASRVADTPAGGGVYIHATGSNGPAGTIIITGAVGDYGKTLSINKNGKTDNNGNFVRITLRQGTFEVDATALNARESHTQALINKTTCSIHFTGTAPVTLFNGTGLYKGIKGKVSDHGFLRRCGPALRQRGAQGPVQLRPQHPAACSVRIDHRPGHRLVRLSEAQRPGGGPGEGEARSASLPPDRQVRAPAGVLGDRSCPRRHDTRSCD